MSEPRVFWIDNEVLISASNMLATFVYKTQQENCTPIVELTAYETLRTELAEITRLHDRVCDQLVAKDEQLQSEREKNALAEEINQHLNKLYNKYFDKVMELRSISEKMYSVLNEYAFSNDANIFNQIGPALQVIEKYKLARSVLAEIGDEK